MRLPARGLAHLHQRVERDGHRGQAAQEHRAPAEMRADRVVERGGDEEAGVIAGLQVAGAHLAPVLRPGLGDIGAGHRPFAADPDAGEKAEDRELPDGIGEEGRPGEDGVDDDRAGERARAAEPVGDRPPDEGQAPADEEQRKQDGAVGADRLRRRGNAGLRQEFGEGGAQDQRVDEAVHAVEHPAGPGAPEADDLVAVELRAAAGDGLVQVRILGPSGLAPDRGLLSDRLGASAQAAPCRSFDCARSGQVAGCLEGQGNS